MNKIWESGLQVMKFSYQVCRLNVPSEVMLPPWVTQMNDDADLKKGEKSRLAPQVEFCWPCYQFDPNKMC